MEQQDIINEAVKRPRGRPKIPEELLKSNNRNEYFKQYYHSSNLSEKLKCDLCNTEITRQKLARHKTTNKCKSKRVYCIEVIEVIEV